MIAKTRTACFTWLLLIVATPAHVACGSQQVGTLWNVQSRHISPKMQIQGDTEGKNRILHGLTANLFEDRIDWSEDEEGFVHLPLLLPSGVEVMFKLSRTSILHPDLQAKFPEIKTFSGPSVDYVRVLHADVDYSPDRGLSAYIRDGKQSLYIDPFNRNLMVYKAYSAQDNLGREPWACSSHELPTDNSTDIPDVGEESNPSEGFVHVHDHGISTAATSGKKYTFSIALIANGEYSKYHGNTVRSVLASMVTVMNRVNGIYKRELGTFFQIHPDTDKLICTFPCSSLKNNVNLLYQMTSFINGKKVDEYDLAHSFSTGSGGVAYLSSICTANRAGGTTGLANPETDLFYVDYVAHEIGHQMGGRHTFTNCNNYIDKSNSSPVEPGSGTTIMAYAGICGSTNVQSNSDPMFHSVNIQEIRQVIEQRVSTGRCGTVTESGVEPRISFTSACTLPANSYFQLGFTEARRNEYFTVEPIDKTYVLGAYQNRAEPRFRSWIPTTRPYRTFPNLYTIIHGLSNVVLDEIVPSSSKVMTFRGMVRTEFSEEELDSDGMPSGTYGLSNYQDTKVTFDARVRPVQLFTNIRSLKTGRAVRIRWHRGGTKRLAGKLKILVAEHDPKMDRISDNTHFNYAEHVAELNWVLVDEVANTGSAVVRMPSISSKTGPTKAHLMIRSLDDACFFFDVIPFIYFDNEAPEKNPNERATKVPTVSPSAASNVPTASPTSLPYSQLYRREMAFCNAFTKKHYCLAQKRDSGKGRRCKYERKSKACETTLKAPPTALFCFKRKNQRQCVKSNCAYDSDSKTCFAP